jgi:hypothetical protein
VISGRSALRAAFRAGGAVATVAGLHTAIAGGRSVAGEGPTGAAIESELRFYGRFHAAYGIALLRAAPRADTDPAAVRALAGTLFASARSEQRASRGAGAIT